MSRTGLLLTLTLLAACPKPAPVETAVEAPAAAPAPAANPELAAFFDEVWQARLADDPVRQAYLGMHDRNDEWTDRSPAAEERRLELARTHLAAMRERFDPATLSPQDALSYRLFEHEVTEWEAGWAFREHDYPVNQMFGAHSWIPSFLISIHQVADKQDAEAYIARVRGVPGLIDELIAGMERRESAGVLPPAFVFPRVLDDCRNILDGAPFAEGEDSALRADFRKKLAGLDLPEDEAAALLADADAAFTDAFGPAYERLIATLEDQQTRATTDDGVWKFADGAAYYAHRLKVSTTTEMSADEIHELGLSEVTRIHEEMRAIMANVGFEGDLQAFFAFMETDPQFLLPDTDEGRAEYLAQATALIDDMESRLDEVFLTKPQSRIEVKRVEPWREQSAGKAFYQRGAPDGSRPGRYYANLYEMADMPTYQMAALAYHEGIPGHHMQGSIAMELTGIPEFRKQGHYTAYGEGWGLYAEFLPKEMGLYADPYSDFGRLAMELWRACRLVVDTGIHHKQWTREQAIAYLDENTPNAEGDIVKAIERYIVMPGQATAYKVGMLEILRLRAHAQQELGEAFDLREFHDVVLTRGPVPLSVLGENVDAWIAAKRAP
ncbi:MAG: DUF885 domain-containing protein [Deltaproteobacteria bacterium]|nr:MAG: DUF885 domain-containing protein [Deltaproteobacteria bacterium]